MFFREKLCLYIHRTLLMPDQLIMPGLLQGQRLEQLPLPSSPLQPSSSADSPPTPETPAKEGAEDMVPDCIHIDF